MSVNSRYPYRMVVTKNVRQALVPVKEALVTPFISGTGVPKDVTADKAGTLPLSVPLITDENGETFFYIRPGAVRFDIELDPISFKQIEDVICDCEKIDELDTLTGLLRFDLDVELLGPETVVDNLIQAGWQVFGVTTLVIEEITGTAGMTGFNIGLEDLVDQDSWGENIGDGTDVVPASTFTTNADFKVKSPLNFAAATDVVLRPVGPPGTEFTDGYVRLTVWYLTLAT